MPSPISPAGNLRNAQRNWTDALTDLSQAITLRQDYAQAYVGRGCAYIETGQTRSRR